MGYFTYKMPTDPITLDPTFQHDILVTVDIP